MRHAARRPAIFNGEATGLQCIDRDFQIMGVPLRASASADVPGPEIPARDVKTGWPRLWARLHQPPVP
jgi:hypothetical protein